MKLVINTTPQRAYRQMLEVIRSIPPLNHLRNRELDLLAMLMYYNYKYKTVEENIRWRIINTISTRKEMQEELGMSEDIFNNNISLVRRSGVIDKEGKILKYLMIDIDVDSEIRFKFKVEKNEL